MDDDLQTVLAYHERSKHHLHRYAPGPGHLDWASQPDPFRTYAGCERTELPLLGDAPPPAYADLFGSHRLPPRPLSRDSVAVLLELAFGLSAWKAYGASRWALRCNPSSGNLHPTEAYVVVQGCPGLDDGVHHYVSRDHLLERRCRLSSPTPLLPPGCLLVGLSSVFWREAWKYGERAFRYCQHDAGHAMAALRFAAAVLGWQARVLETSSDAQIAALLGLDREADFAGAEREHPDCVLLVGAAPLPAEVPAAPLLAATREWTGQANRLSPHHAHEWPAIETVARACVKPVTVMPPAAAPALPAPLPTDCRLPAAQLIRRRRSAQSFDGATPLGRAAFFRMLDTTLPRAHQVPWDTWPRPARIHLALFVHRVEGLLPGLYLLGRDPSAEAGLRRALGAGFDWAPVEEAPGHLPLYRLAAGDFRTTARTLACHQDIAADGAFSLAMLGAFEDALEEGPWAYRTLFWEAGMTGQVLYLEAEAAGLQGTGIGCYFDDAVHALLGIQGRRLQSLYHFTVGRAVPDERLQTLPPYAHLRRPRATP